MATDTDCLLRCVKAWFKTESFGDVKTANIFVSSCSEARSTKIIETIGFDNYSKNI